ncbi:MAG: hypothetical protein EOP38_24100 [Rubrivivax sp.]|nr:MAG: hypothetical protein EOP38_24100 [Rubrivivax sp.]
MTATADSTGSAAPGVERPSNHWSEDRTEIGAQATHQIESLLYALQSQNAEARIDQHFLHSALVRMKDLNSVAMSMLDQDELRQTAEMEKVVRGSWVGVKS